MGRTMQRSQRDMEDAERKKSQAWWGIAGLILLVTFAIISIILSMPISESTLRLVPGMAIATWRILVGIGLFVLLLALSAVFFSLFAPKRKERFSERELDKERKIIQNEIYMRKERQKQMRKQIAKARREGK